ncbi:MAG: hypothetical protein J2P28_16740, partial [Actinobacteria bacterium]|nr:hypothetical protein [Actinomycetota bacterium]
MVPPDMADGGPDSDQHPVQPDHADEGQADADEAGRVATSTRPEPAPVTRRMRPIRPRGPSRFAWLRPAHAAGALLGRLTVLPAVLLLAWLLPGVPLLLVHDFLPTPMVLISVPLALVLVAIGLRVVPATWPRLLPPGRAGEPGWASWFGLLGTIAVVVGLTVWQITLGSQALIVVRDPGVYLQAGYWVAQHGSLPIPETLAAFGGAHSGLNFGTTGFLTHGSGIYPMVTPGLPLVLAGAFWVNGTAGATVMGPILGGLAMLSFAGLAARLVGPRWAPAGALLLGISMPQQYVGRTTLSETALQIAVFGGLCLLADSAALRAVRPVAGWAVVVDPAGRPARWAAAILALMAGLALGFGLVISLDALPLLLAVIPFGCALIVGHRQQATLFPIGFLVGVGYGVLGLFLLDRPFLDRVDRTVGLAGVVIAWLLALSVVVIQFARIGWVRRAAARTFGAWPLRGLPGLSAFLVLAALIGLAIRPYVQKVHGHPNEGDYSFIASLQHQQHLVSDPTRTYAEQTLYWVIWYIGLPTVLLGAFGLAHVLRHSLRALLSWRDPTGVWRMWALPTAIICAGMATALWAPDIMPDQPWASRRLVVIAIPGLILCAMWAASSLARRARMRGAHSFTAGLAGLFCFAAMLLP